jgi:hypothetical protein
MNQPAPQPKISSLTDVRPPKEKQEEEKVTIHVLRLSPAAQFYMAKQMRRKMYTKQRNDFFAQGHVASQPVEEQSIDGQSGYGYGRTQ